MRHRTKFREDWSNRSGDMADFRYLTLGTLKSVELRPHAKFWRNRSKRG